MIPFRESGLPATVPETVMAAQYAALRTPVKHGAMCRFEDTLTDSPSVWYQDGRWYMMYLRISKECAASGYTTWVSVSEDLLHWTPLGEVMSRTDAERWDARQVAGYLGLADMRWDGTNTPGTVDGQYVVTYLGGNADGYEPTPLYMGEALTADLTDPGAYRRLAEPILSPYDADCRPGERRALYRSFVFADTDRITGYPYGMVYNAKAEDYKERIFLAVSEDARHWQRYGDRPVLDGTAENPHNKIVADAQLLRRGELYLMVYFSYEPDKPAYSTFAASYDLVHWTPWRGEPLIAAQEPWEDEHAHKSWIVVHNGCVYNYYCAVNSKGERFIALATPE